MDIITQISFFICFIGAFNSFLLSFYFIRKNTISSYFFGFLLFCLGIRVGKSVLFYFYADTPKTIPQIGLTACLFIGPSLYFFLKAELEKVEIMPKKWKTFWLVLLLSTLAFGFAVPYSTYPKIWNQYVVAIIYATWGIFVLLSFLKFYPVFQKAPTPSGKWYKIILLANLLIYIVYLVAYLFRLGQVYITGAITLSITFYLSLGMVLLQKKQQDCSALPPNMPTKKLILKAVKQSFIS